MSCFLGIWFWGATVPPHNLVFPSALTLAHLAFAAAASLALVAGLLRRSFLAGVDLSFALAHLALPAALMAALPAALIRLLPLFAIPFAFAQRIFLALAKAFMSLRLWAADM